MTYDHVTGGVVSGSGKGVTAITAGRLKACGRRVTPIKIDPYVNTDAGTMPPLEHGGDGDLDLGKYKRFQDIKLTRDKYITDGKNYQHVIAKEREGDYLAETMQGLRSHVGGTTHLGSRKSFFNAKDRKSAKRYDDKNFVDERHRHRSKVNPDMVERQEKAGLSLAAKDEIGERIEV